MTGRYYKETLMDGKLINPLMDVTAPHPTVDRILINRGNVGKSMRVDSTALRTFNSMRVVQAIANHMAKIRQELNDNQPTTMVDAKGRVWKASSSEGVPTWVSNDSYERPYSWNLSTPRLKKIVIAVKVAIFRG